MSIVYKSEILANFFIITLGKGEKIIVFMLGSVGFFNERQKTPSQIDSNKLCLAEKLFVCPTEERSVSAETGY